MTLTLAIHGGMYWHRSVPTQFSMIAGGSRRLEVAPSGHGPRANKWTPTTRTPSEHRRAVHVLKNLLWVIEQIDLPETETSCPHYREQLNSLGHESTDRPHWISVRLEMHQTQWMKHFCGHCYGSMVTH